MSTNKQIANRIRRSQGQLNGVLGMIERGESCKSVVHQLSAARNAIDKIIALIATENLEQCMMNTNYSKEERDEHVQEAIHLILKIS